MGSERLAGVAAESRDEVEHAGGEAGLGHDLGQHETADRSELGRLENDGAPSSERVGNLCADLVERKVPRCDGADYPDGFFDDVAGFMILKGEAVQNVGCRVERTDAHADLEVDGLGSGHSDFSGLDVCQFILARV